VLFSVLGPSRTPRSRRTFWWGRKERSSWWAWWCRTRRTPWSPCRLTLPNCDGSIPAFDAFFCLFVSHLLSFFLLKGGPWQPWSAW